MRFDAAQRAVVEEAKRIQRDARKAATKARPKSPKADRGRERDNAHLAFIRRLPCASCMTEGPNDAAHLRLADAARGKPYTGKGVKPDDKWTTPLCRPCHERQHSGSEAAFWSAVGGDPITLCEQLYAASGDEDRARLIITTGADATRRASRSGGGE